MKSKYLALPVLLFGCTAFTLLGQDAPDESNTLPGEPIELDPYNVVSTATRTERLANELPIRTEVISTALFRNTGVSDLSAAIEYLPGARVENNCQNCGAAELQLLGLGAGYNQLLFDGQPLFGGLAAVYGIEHIPTRFVERLEVVKGGASILYGPGAVAGVINIIPREPVVRQAIFETTLELPDGELAYEVTGLYDWVNEDRSLAFTTFAEYREADAIDLNDDGFTDLSEREFSTLGTHFWIYPQDNTRLTVDYAFTYEDRRGGDNLDRIPHETQITEQTLHDWHRGTLRWDHDLTSELTYHVAAALSYIERDSYYGGIGGEPLPDQPGHDPMAYAAAVDDARLLYGYTDSLRYQLESIFTYRFVHHTLSFGAQYLHDEVFDEKRNDLGQSLLTDGSLASRVGQDPIADDSFDNFGIFLQNEWDPNPNWTIIAGLRADNHSLIEDWVISPRAAVRYTASPQLTLRASISTGFRAPEIFNEDFHIDILDDPTRTRNSPDLKEETSISYAAGCVYTPAFAANKLQLDLELFRTDIEDTFNVSDIVFTDASGSFKLRENAGGSTVQGFEANALYRFTTNFSIEGGISYVDANFDAAQEIIPGFFTDRFLESPRWTGVAQLNYRNEEFLDLFLGLVYTGPMIAVNEVAPFVNEETDAFFVVDFSVTRHFDLGSGENAPHLELTAGVRNLFDERQDDLQVGVDRDPTYLYGPRFPRTFFLSASVIF